MSSILSSSALTTYASVKARLNAIGQAIVDADHQTEVERLINAVSDAVVDYCGRELHKAARTEVYAPPRGERLVLNVRPIAASPAPTATIDGVAATVAIENATKGWLRCDNGWQGEDYEEAVGGSVTLSSVPGTAEEVVSVTYTAGYVTPAQEADLTVTQVPTSSTVQTLYAPQTAAKAGTLTVVTVAGTTKATVTVTWNDGASSTLVNAAEVLNAALPVTYNLGGLDADLAGFFLVVPLAANATSSSVVYTIAETDGTRDLPWSIEEAVIVSVAHLWRMRMAGYVGEVMAASTGLLPDVVLPWLEPYRQVV